MTPVFGQMEFLYVDLNDTVLMDDTLKWRQILWGIEFQK